MIKKLIGHQRGFTIAELMIATLVFSVILTVVTMGVISFSSRYYKGVHASTTQNTTRNIMDTITQAIQFGDARVDPTGANNFFCAGGNVFMFDTSGVMYEGSVGQRGVYVAPKDRDACQNQLLNSGRQMLGKRMRITTFSVSPVASVPNMYRAQLVIAYGEDNMLCAPSLPQGCSESANYSAANFINRPDVRCKPGSGNQYCAVSRLTANVQKRVVPN